MRAENRAHGSDVQMVNDYAVLNVLGRAVLRPCAWSSTLCRARYVMKVCARGDTGHPYEHYGWGRQGGKDKLQREIEILFLPTMTASFVA